MATRKKKAAKQRPQFSPLTEAQKARRRRALVDQKARGLTDAQAAKKCGMTEKGYQSWRRSQSDGALKAPRGAAAATRRRKTTTTTGRRGGKRTTGQRGRLDERELTLRMKLLRDQKATGKPDREISVKLGITPEAWGAWRNSQGVKLGPNNTKKRSGGGARRKLVIRSRTPSTGNKKKRAGGGGQPSGAGHVRPGDIVDHAMDQIDRWNKVLEIFQS